MDPILGSIISGALSGGASLLGGMQSNAATAQQTLQNNIFNAQLAAQQQGANTVFQDRAQSYTQANLNNAEAFNAQQAQYQRDFESKMFGYAADYNSRQAAVQRGYETEMANTAYQRAVRDMKAAGLNPILSAGTGGAATPNVSSPSIGAPSGATASVGAPGGPMTSAGLTAGTSARMADVVSPAVSSAYQGARAAIDLSQAMLNLDKTKEQTKNEAAGPSGVVPAIRRGVSDLTGMPPSDWGQYILNQLFPKGAAGFFETPENVKQAGSTAKEAADAALRVGKAAVQALGGEVSSWFSPPATSSSPGNPGTVKAKPKLTDRLGSSLTPGDLKSWYLGGGMSPQVPVGP